jgi:3',5'-cyclic AMP phosphodiesterase CpdA
VRPALAGRVLRVCLFASVAFLSSCATSGRVPETGGLPPGARAAYPRARFVVISDPHVYASADGLPVDRSAAERIGLLYGRSPGLFREAITRAIELRPDFVLLPGDLTKDGELPGHEEVVRELSRLSEAGIRAYVVPGNHDVENPRAVGYVAGKALRLPSPSADRFAELYSCFGYGDALSRDSRSLSYVAQLLPGIRLLAIDPFLRPARPDPLYPEPDGVIGRETMSWIRSQLEAAGRDGDAVIAMCHLPLVEHFEGQAKFFPSSLPRGRDELVSLLVSHGASLAFTGHFHFQDVVRNRIGDADFYDVATGSLAYYPMPYRLVDIVPGEGGERAVIRSFRLPEADAGAVAAAGKPRKELETWMTSVLERKLRNVLVPRSEASSIASSFVRAYIALVSGDESPGPGDGAFPEVHSLAGRIVRKRLAPLLKSLWRDLPPADNELEIEL